MTRWMGASVLTCVALLSGTASAAARLHDAQALPAVRIRDLPYGDVLFYYEQGKDFEAATRLGAYQHWKLLPHHAADGRLLLGGLYLSLGMYDRAGKLFDSLLTHDVPRGVRNRAWFYLGRIRYARGEYAKSERALARINGRMSPDLEAQRELLSANVWMHQGQFDRAARLLEHWSGSQQGWTAYARLNLGVALVRQRELAKAAPILSSVGTMYALAPEMLALKDRANLALGLAYLQAGKPRAARTALDRVRLDGPFSNEALLAAGWVDAADGNYHAALTPWLTLRKRNALDPAVEEAYLTVPYAFVKLEAPAQAAEYYRVALQVYANEAAQIEQAAARIRSGNLLAELLKHRIAKGVGGTSGNDPLNDGALPDQLRYGWFWHLSEVPNSPEAHYLYAVFAGNAFQEGLRNYRDLQLMRRMLAEWASSMDAFQEMIAARTRAYAVRVPKVDALLASGRLAGLRRREGALERRLAQVAKTRDAPALASARELAEWARIRHVQTLLTAAPDTPTFSRLRARLRLVRGVLLYRMDKEFAARLWRQRRALKRIGRELARARLSWAQLKAARAQVPVATADFAGRVTTLQRRIQGLQGRLGAAQTLEGRSLAELAVRKLEQQKSRVEDYRSQAQFALAALYDRAARSRGGSKVPGPIAPGSTVSPGEVHP